MLVTTKPVPSVFLLFYFFFVGGDVLFRLFVFGEGSLFYFSDRVLYNLDCP